MRFRIVLFMDDFADWIALWFYVFIDFCLFSLFVPGPVLRPRRIRSCLRETWRSRVSRLTRPASPPPARSPPPAPQVQRSFMTVQLFPAVYLYHVISFFYVRLMFSCDWHVVFLCVETRSAPPKTSRPGTSRQLQRWPESHRGRMKRGGNTFKSKHTRLVI